jgi:hypothetical protein
MQGPPVPCTEIGRTPGRIGTSYDEDDSRRKNFSGAQIRRDASGQAWPGRGQTPGGGGRVAASIGARAAIGAVTTVRMLRVEEGLYALQVGEIAGNLGEIAGMVVPVAQVSAPFAEDGNGVEIVATFPGRGPWLGKDGGTVILRSPIGAVT